MNYQNYFQNIETELPRRIIVANGLSDLPAERQEKISEIVAEMMITRSIHALLAHLTDTKFEEISDEEMQDAMLGVLWTSISQHYERYTRLRRAVQLFLVAIFPFFVSIIIIITRLSNL